MSERERLSNELQGVHDALGVIPEFHARAPDIDMTTYTARAILRDAIRELVAGTPGKA